MPLTTEKGSGDTRRGRLAIQAFTLKVRAKGTKAIETYTQRGKGTQIGNNQLEQREQSDGRVRGKSQRDTIRGHRHRHRHSHRHRHTQTHTHIDILTGNNGDTQSEHKSAHAHTRTQRGDTRTWRSSGWKVTAWNMAVLTKTLLVLSSTSAFRGPLALGSCTTPQEPAPISAVLTSNGLAPTQRKQLTLPTHMMIQLSILEG